MKPARSPRRTLHRAAPCRRNPAHRRAGGFSLLEVVIAMAILAFGLLTLALMQIQALKQGAVGRHTGDAAAVARTYLEQAHRVPWAILTADLGAGWQNPGWAGAAAVWNQQIAQPSGGTATEHSYDVSWRVSAVGGSLCLRDVEIRVSWDEQDHSNPKQLVLATRRYNWGGASC